MTHPLGATVRFIAWDALRRLRRPLVPTLVAVLIAFGATSALFATTGLAVAGQQRAIDVIDSPSGRLIVVADAQGNAGLEPATVDAIARLSGVEWVLGVGVARDVRNASLERAATVPARTMFGSLPPPLGRDTARPLAPGEAIVAQGADITLGFRDDVGAVIGRGVEAAVVGSFSARAPLEALDGSILIAGGSEYARERVTTVWISAESVSQLPALVEAVRASLRAETAGSARIDTAEELALLGEEVSASLASTARSTLIGLLAAVAVLMATVQFGRVAGLARDIGRARALGATRTTVVVQMLVNASLCAAIGALLGTLVGVALTTVLAGAVPPVGFTVSIGVLVVLAATAGAVPPAIRAARLDPVSILRVP